MYYIMFCMYLCWIYDRDFAALSQLMEQKKCKLKYQKNSLGVNYNTMNAQVSQKSIIAILGQNVSCSTHSGASIALILCGLLDCFLYMYSKDRKDNSVLELRGAKW